MKTLQIAFRNIFRNARRSLMTVLAISVSAVSVLLFGGFIFAIMYGMQTSIVQNIGHLHVYQKGYFDFGSGSPGAYGVSRYEEIIGAIKEDPQLKPLVQVVTPTLNVYGIAGNFEAEASKTFLGQGVVPSDGERMKNWDDYKLGERRHHKESGLSDADTEGGVVGIGMARMLQLCDKLQAENCKCNGAEKAVKVVEASTRAASASPPEIQPAEQPLPQSATQPELQPAQASADGGGEDFSTLAELDIQAKAGEKPDPRPKLEILAATVGGAPNVVSLYVNKAVNQGVKEMDDSFIKMHLSLAQRLLYGRGEKKVSGIVVQLKHTRDIPVARARLARFFSDRHLDLEIRDFRELSPMYGQVISMFGSIFTFISIIMGVIVLFTIVNTMSMSVMERVNEIGTVRALGVQRRGVLRQFLMEGCLLGTLGATIGVGAAVTVALAINAGAVTWIPPNNVEPVPLTILIFENAFLLPGTLVALVVLAVVSSFLPARKASRMAIVDALRHV